MLKKKNIKVKEKAKQNYVKNISIIHKVITLLQKNNNKPNREFKRKIIIIKNNNYYYYCRNLKNI